MRATPLWLVLAGCTGSSTVTLPGVPTTSSTGDTGTPPRDVTVTVTDEALASGYLDLWFGELMRGRACIPADFDGDGDLDVFSGNPGDTSLLLRNDTEPGGPLRFEPTQILAEGSVYWGGVAADVDNDGDPDLVVAGGGNELPERDVFWANDGPPDAPLRETDMDLVPRRPDGSLVLNATAGIFAADFDLDGWVDLFANNEVLNHGNIPFLQPEDRVGLNGLWRNQGDGSFEDVGYAVGLDSQLATRNSHPIDYDNDGDLDLIENNWWGPNVVWRNELVETGALSFVEVTSDLGLGGGELQWPGLLQAMCVIAADLNQDGWEDYVQFRRRLTEVGEPEVHGEGHLLWLNVQGTGFVEASRFSTLNDGYVFRDHDDSFGVMGCQIADLDADGTPDLFMGNGGPRSGGRNTLKVSTDPVLVDIDGVGEVLVPQWEDWSDRIDFPAELPADYTPHPLMTYPYRSHGSAFADLDGDGLLELLVHNGGPSQVGDGGDMREPDRLFVFDIEPRPHWLRLQLRGDGVTVPLDAPGTRVHAVVAQPDGGTRDVWVTHYVGSGFGAQNDPDVLLGLGAATEVVELTVTWTDGTTTMVPVDAVDQRLEVVR